MVAFILFKTFEINENCLKFCKKKISESENFWVYFLKYLKFLSKTNFCAKKSLFVKIEFLKYFAKYC